jgi:cytochrome c2
MTIDARLVSASILALALAACGSPADDADEPEVLDETALPEVPVAAETPPLDETGGEAEEAMDEGEEPTAATPSPSPTPTATRAAAQPAPAQAAASAPRPPIFAVCGACHAVEPGDHGIGPSLAGVFGAQAGHADGFEYSDAMESAGLTWNQANLDRYLENPQGVVPGTTMSYAGLKNDEQRQAVIDYLKTL